MKIFGTILPFIGFKSVPVDEDLRELLDLKPGVTEIETFSIGWLGWSLNILCNIEGSIRGR